MPKKKILVIGKRNGILQWFENILDIDTSNLNMEIQGFALNHNNSKERLIKKIILNKSKYTARLLNNKIKSFQPDLILIADLFYFDAPILNVLSQSNAKKVHWIGDFFDQRLAVAKDVIDLFCFTDSTFIDDAKQIGIDHTTYLPLAYNPKIFYENDSKKSDRLLFIGAWSPNRQELIEQIPIPMSIYGKGWDQLKKAQCTIHPHNIPLNQVAELYRQHRYVLNLINKKNIRQGMNMRCFEAPACGNILVSEYVEDLKYSFDLEQDIITFSSAEELQHVLNQSSIDAASAMNKVQKNHTYKNRLVYLSEILLS